jgi:hypothetical protein
VLPLVVRGGHSGRDFISQYVFCIAMPMVGTFGGQVGQWGSSDGAAAGAEWQPV